MRVRSILAFLAAASLSLLLSCSSGPAIGSTAPDFAVKDENGKVTKLSDHRGSLVLLNFWATWCTPCQDEAPDLERIKSTFRDRRFRMMAVSVDTDWDVIHQFNSKYKVELPTYLDPGQQAARKYKVEKFPETFIIDANGTILQHFWTPPQGWSKFETKLEELIAAQERMASRNPAEKTARTTP